MPPVPPAETPRAPSVGDVVGLVTTSGEFVVIDVFTAYRVRRCDGYSEYMHDVRLIELKLPPLLLSDRVAPIVRLPLTVDERDAIAAALSTNSGGKVVTLPNGCEVVDLDEEDTEILDGGSVTLPPAPLLSWVWCESSNASPEPRFRSTCGRFEAIRGGSRGSFHWFAKDLRFESPDPRTYPGGSFDTADGAKEVCENLARAAARTETIDGRRDPTL